MEGFVVAVVVEVVTAGDAEKESHFRNTCGSGNGAN